MEYTDGEVNALEAINETLECILDMDGKRLQTNQAELTQAIRVLQGFVKQHVLHRIDPYEWADWWGKADEPL